MRKIPTMFVRDWDGNPKHVTREPNPECAWVFAGEGEATVKWDGTCVMLDDQGDWWARREVKPGKADPPNFVLIEEDAETAKRMGWEPVEQSSFAKWHAEALGVSHRLLPGTYELLGPKVNGNPDGFEAHILMEHGWAPLSIREAAKTAPRDYDGLAAWLAEWPNEGIVWHHLDGRMAKIKRRDFPR
ncbi:RNA ligase 1 family protein [Nonomuraea angiospora]|uniref:RNA ligase 1 family protein n=1 Tax=Nonomuraea angiospora TaxID=46172 RepID=UPI0029AB7ED3|nr:DUF5565 family protein [Nonomuraea angiospora]MDX3110138.1 DUF5565 family protein [Nonomuraea angiospora]